MSNKVRENRIRRMAERQGLILAKSRRRDHMALDYGKYALVNDSNCVVYGSASCGYDADLDDIEEFLTCDSEAILKMAIDEMRLDKIAPTISKLYAEGKEGESDALVKAFQKAVSDIEAIIREGKEKAGILLRKKL